MTITFVFSGPLGWFFACDCKCRDARGSTIGPGRRGGVVATPGPVGGMRRAPAARLPRIDGWTWTGQLPSAAYVQVQQLAKRIGVPIGEGFYTPRTGKRLEVYVRC